MPRPLEPIARPYLHIKSSSSSNPHFCEVSVLLYFHPTGRAEDKKQRRRSTSVRPASALLSVQSSQPKRVKREDLFGAKYIVYVFLVSFSAGCPSSSCYPTKACSDRM